MTEQNSSVGVQRMLADYQHKWFGDSWKNRSFAYWTIALGGEVGEFCQSLVAESVKLKMQEELADIGVYMYLMSDVLGFNLDEYLATEGPDIDHEVKFATVNSSVYWMVAYLGLIQNAYKKGWRDGKDPFLAVWQYLADFGACVHILARKLHIDLKHEIEQKTLKNDKKYSGRSESVISRAPPEPNPAGLQ